jgi:cytoskeleton protein RodZ
VSAEDTDGGQQDEQSGGLSAVGKRLAAAREDQERELGSVASDLHLNLEVVAALEAGDESALPAVTFVRGYIKSYSRLLGLDEKQLLAMLPSTEDYRPAVLKPVGMRRKQLNLPLGKWLLWLMVLTVVVVLLVYGIPTAERLITRTGQPLEQGALPLPLGDELQQVENNAAPALPEPAPIEPAPMEAAVEPSVEADVELEQVAAPAAELPTPREEPESAAEEETQTVGPALITLRFNEDSWVEMESNGRKLVVGTQPAGSERTVRAEPPVQILLGNAPGVVLEYRGKPVDLEPYRRGKVARVVLED